MILGVTGGIACGKSTVIRAFQQLGAAVVSADQLAREVVVPGGETLRSLVERFGAGILQADGSLDRAMLARRVFASAEERAALDAITHPAIRALAEVRLQMLVRAGEPLVLYEAPLLYETGAQSLVDAVLVVSVADAQQLERLQGRDGLSEAEAIARIKAQMPLAEKVARADYVVDNSGSEAATVAQVQALFSRLRATAPLRGPR